MTVPTCFDPVAIVAAELAQSMHLSVDEAGEAIRGILDRLFREDIVEHLGRAIEDSLSHAHTAYAERPDLYVDPAVQRITARIVVAAVRAVLLGGDEEDADTQVGSPTTVEAVARALDSVSYKDVEFEAVALPDGRLGVRATARRPNTYRPTDLKTVSRIVPLMGGDPARTAFAAALRIEEHEAAELFTVGDRRSFDPHMWPMTEHLVPAFRLDSNDA